MKTVDLRPGEVYAYATRHGFKWKGPAQPALLLSATPHHLDRTGALRRGRETQGRGATRFPMAVKVIAPDGTVEWQPKLVCIGYIVCEWVEYEAGLLAEAALAEAEAILAGQLEGERAELERGLKRAGMHFVMSPTSGHVINDEVGATATVSFQWEDLVRLLRSGVEFTPRMRARIEVPWLVALELIRCR